MEVVHKHRVNYKSKIANNFIAQRRAPGFSQVTIEKVRAQNCISLGLVCEEQVASISLRNSVVKTQFYKNTTDVVLALRCIPSVPLEKAHVL